MRTLIRVAALAIVAAIVSTFAVTAPAGAQFYTARDCISMFGNHPQVAPEHGRTVTIVEDSYEQFFRSDRCSTKILAAASEIAPMVAEAAARQNRPLAPGEIWGSVTWNTLLPVYTQQNALPALRAIDLSVWVYAGLLNYAAEQDVPSFLVSAYFSCYGRVYHTGLDYRVEIAITPKAFKVEIIYGVGAATPPYERTDITCY